jgi:hypothetical protein
VQGCFEIDNPDEEAYADWDTADFNDDEEEMEAAKRFPLHYWVEAKHAGRVWIVDITADQFNDECDEEFEPVIVTTYRDQPRYRKQKSPWRSL